MKDVKCPYCGNLTIISERLESLLYTTAIVGISCESCNVVISIDYVKENMQ